MTLPRILHTDVQPERSSSSLPSELETLLLEALNAPEPERALRELLVRLPREDAEQVWEILEAHPGLFARLRSPEDPPLGTRLLSELAAALGFRIETTDLSAEDRLDGWVEVARDELAVRGAESHAVADATLSLRDELVAELGLRKEVPIGIAPIGEALGRSGPDGVVLSPGFDPWSLTGRALLAHELAHEAQRTLAGPSDLAQAEFEAGSIMSAVLRGQAAPTPRFALSPGVYAACGPQAMEEARKREEEEELRRVEEVEVEKEKEKVTPEPEDEPTPVIGGSTGGGRPPSTPEKPGRPPEKNGGDRPAPEPEKETPTTAPSPIECDNVCPSPLPEHLQDAPVRAPAAQAPHGKGEERTLHLAGHVIRIRLPENAKAGQVRVHFRQADSPYGAMTLKSALLTLGEDLSIKSGQVVADIRLGRFVHVPDARLAVTAKGRVALQVRGAKVSIGTMVKGTVDLTLEPGGISGAGVFLAQDIVLGPRLTLKGGVLAVRVSKGGAVSAHGQLTLDVNGLGQVELEACFVDGELRGKVTATLTRPIPFGLGRITRVQVSGCYGKNGWSLHGEVDLAVRDWVEGTVKADLSRDTAGTLDWSLEGDLCQVRPIGFGEFSIHDASLHIKNTQGIWEPAIGQVQYRLPHVMGQLDATIDLEHGKVSGRGDAQVVEPIPVGLGHLDEGQLVATVEDNALVSVTGSATLSVAHRGEPTFEVRCEEALWDVLKGELHARGDMQVLRDVVLGNEERLHARIPRGPAGQYVLEYGRLVHAETGLGLDVQYGSTPVGRGALALEYNAGQDLEGSLDFSLIDRMGVPNFETGPLFLVPGARFSARLEGGVLGRVALESAQWELANTVGAGRIVGVLNGAYDFDKRVGSLSGQAWVHEPWSMQTALGELVLGPEGKPAEAQVRIGEAGLEELSGTLGFELAVTAGPLAAGAPLGLSGTVAGAFDPETAALSGSFDAALKEGSRLAVPLVGPYRLAVAGGGRLAGTFVGHELDGPLTADLDFVFEKAETAFLKGRLTQGALDLGKGLVSGALSLGLVSSIDVATMGLTLPPGLDASLTEGTALTCTLTDNVPSRVGGQLATLFTLGGEVLAQASLEVDWDLAGETINAFGFGQLLADLPLSESQGENNIALSQWGLLVASGSQVGLTIADNQMAAADVQLDVWATRGEERLAHAFVVGTWLMGETSGLSGTATVTTTQTLRMAQAGRFGVWLAAGSTVSALVLDSAFSEGSGQIALLLEEGGIDYARLGLEGTLGEDFTGLASLQVLEPIVLAERQVGDTRFEIAIARDSGGQVHLEASVPTVTEGALILEVVGDSVPFARGGFDIQADFTQAATDVTAQGEVEVFAPLPVGAAGDFQWSLAPPTRAHADLSQGLRSLEGELHFDLARVGKTIGSLAIKGRYVGGKTPELDGQATVVIAQGFPLYEAMPYEVGFAPSRFQADLEKGQITSVSGAFGVHLEQRGPKSEAPLGTLSLMLDGRYTRALGAKKGEVDGKGQVKVEGELDVANTDTFVLRLRSGTDASVTLEKNKVKALDGKVSGGLDHLTPASGEDKRILELEAEAHYRPAAGKKGSTIDAKGQAVIVGRHLVHSGPEYQVWLARKAGARAAITIENNEVVSLGGMIGVEVHDGRGPLFGALVDGQWSGETGYLEGRGTVELMRDVTFPAVESGPRVVVKKGSKGRSTVAKNTLSGFDGELKLAVHDHTGPLIAITGSGVLSAKGELESASGKATLLRPIDVPAEGGSLVRISHISASARVEKGRLTEVLGSMRFSVPRLGDRFAGSLEGGFAQPVGSDTKAVYWGKGTLRMPLIDEPAHGRKLEGQVGVEVSKAGDWAVSGQLDYQLASGIGGKVKVSLDKRLEPEIDVDFIARNVRLIEGRSLFDRKFDLIPRLTIGTFPVSAGFGVSAGLSMAMQSLVVSPEIKATGWRPLADKQSVPDFESRLALNWGLDLRAALAAYLQVQLGIPSLAALYAGLEAELGLDMPVRFAPTGRLWGGRSGFGGELDISVSLEPKLGLDLTPYVGGEVLFFELGRHEFETYRLELGSPFTLSWGTTYSFGDKPRAPASRAATDNRARDAKVSQVKKSHSQAPSYPHGDKPAPTPAPGMPRVGGEAGLDMLGKGGAAAGSEKLTAMMQAIDALGRVGAAAKHYMDVTKPSFAMTNPIKAITLSKEAWENLAAEGRKLYVACEGIFGSLKHSVPLWVRLIIEAPPGQTPGLIEAWFEEDDFARTIISAGMHTSLSLAERVQLTEAMLSGSTGDADEEAILKVLENAARRGDLAALVAKVGLDSLQSAIDGAEYDQLMVLLRKAGLVRG